MSETALALRAIDKRFGSVQALAAASLTVRRGTVHAVLGENGAGKTTLMRIAFGMMRPDAGEIAIDDVPVVLTSSRDAIDRGLGMVHQHFTLVDAMTTAENIALGGHGRYSRREVVEQVRRLAAHTGLAVDPAARVATLGVGAQQRVEILKALSRNARTLILDEPTAVLTPGESEELFLWVRRFVADGGTAVLVTHKLQEALAIADDVTVLRRGAGVLAARSSDLDIAALVRAVTGEERAELTPALPRHTGRRDDVVARLVAASARDARGVVRIRDVSMECHAGEVVGIAGVEGSGVHELLRLLAGRLVPSDGSVTLPPRIGFIPEDRLRDAILEEFTLTENVALRGAALRRGRMAWSALTAQTAAMLRRHDVRAPSPATRAGELSGGNQQKLVVGRELDDAPMLVVAENPARGLDVRATEHVLRELLESTDAGCSVVLYSADVDELLPLADRMFVVFAGRVHEVPVERSAVAGALLGTP